MTSADSIMRPLIDRNPCMSRSFSRGATSSSKPAAASEPWPWRTCLTAMALLPAAATRRAPTIRWRRGKPHHAATGHVGHLPVHGRRPQPSRHLRSQARVDAPPRPTLARQFRHRPHADGHRRQQAAGQPAHVSAKYGQAGIDVSDWLPHIATCADDLACCARAGATG